jgi:hypothetical protein
MQMIRNPFIRYVLGTLPERVAAMYLGLRGEWGLPGLSGISTASLLADDGTTHPRTSCACVETGY